MTNEESCLVRHFSYYHDLSTAQEELLRTLERDPREVARGDHLWHEGDRAGHFYTVKSGWAYSYSDLEDGNRQVLEIFMPGDVIGLRDFAFPEHQDSTAMLKEGTVCPFPLKRLTEVFDASRTLTVLFFAMASREQALLAERLINLGRRSASQRLANFIAELYSRLKRTNPDLGETMPLPVSQEILADALGLSAVHTSRTFSELREKGVLYNRKLRVSIPDFPRLAEEGGFTDGHLKTGLWELLSATTDRPRAH